MAKTEVRTFRASSNLRSMSQGDEMVIAGRALSYNTTSADLGGFVERLSPGCFARHLATSPDVLCRREHETGFLLGRTKNGTLQLNDGPDGLDFRCTIDPADPIAVSTHAAIKSGLIDSMSFAFQVDGNGGDEFATASDEAGNKIIALRLVKRALLLDVAPVCNPAYPRGTSVQARRVDYSVTPVSDQAPIRAQIALWEQRRRQRIADARSLMADNSPLDAETLLRVKKFGYSEDLLLELRAAGYAKQIREGRWS